VASCLLRRRFPPAAFLASALVPLLSLAMLFLPCILTPLVFIGVAHSESCDLGEVSKTAAEQAAPPVGTPSVAITTFLRGILDCDAAAENIAK
jgi:hypothetical protein